MFRAAFFFLLPVSISLLASFAIVLSDFEFKSVFRFLFAALDRSGYPGWNQEQASIPLCFTNARQRERIPDPNTRNLFSLKKNIGDNIITFDRVFYAIIVVSENAFFYLKLTAADCIVSQLYQVPSFLDIIFNYEFSDGFERADFDRDLEKYANNKFR